VAKVSEVPAGTALAFTAGAIIGHVLNENGNLRALSAICPHMGCIVNWTAATGGFNCPCHNANFNSDGVFQPTPDYPRGPQPLIRIPLKVENGEVYVLSTPLADESGGPRARRAGRPEPT
jgi:Rieske Fe-S protein